MIKRILVGIGDPQHTGSSSQYACELARRFGASITAIAVTDLARLRNVGPVAAGSGSYAAELMQDRIKRNDDAIRQSLDVLVRRLDEARIPCRIVENGGDPYETLAKVSRYHDLMILGLHGLFEHGVMEEPPNELIHLIESGVQPVLAVGTDYREVKRILIAYSGSVESAKTIRSFASHILWPKASVKIVHFGASDGEGPALLAESRSYLHDHGIEAETELVEDSPNTQLLQYADNWQADLIVVGNSAKTLLRRRVFGETALRAMHESHVPLYLSQ